MQPNGDSEPTVEDDAEQYSWGGKYSPENIISWFNPNSYSLPPIGEDPREYGSRVPVETDRHYPVEPDRIIRLFILLVLFSILGVVGTQMSGWGSIGVVQEVITVGLWMVAALYLLSGLSWLRNLAVGMLSDYPTLEHGSETIQVRILTINAQGVVQRTVDHLPESLTDRHVMAESDIEITGAEVHVVPDEFECVATNKGRALEWARQNIPCEKEYVLYLDEDTLVEKFEGLPDADIVQFREWPMKTDSWWTYWAEITRMGFQISQVGYANRDIPLYAWGGGLAVRNSVEDDITWDFDTLVENTVFTWFAVQNGADYAVVETRFRNQAPMSVKDMIDQRQRWLVGTIREEEYLSLGNQLLLTVRNVVWVFSPLLSLISIAVTLAWALGLPTGLEWSIPLQIGCLVFLVMTFMWVVAGVDYYGIRLQVLPVLVLWWILIVLHSLGALKGFIFPPRTFKATKKSKSGSTQSVSDSTKSDRD